MVAVESVDRIFKQFLPDLTKRFTIRKLSLAAGLSYDAAYRHVHHLISEGALREERVGAYSSVSVNFGSSLARKIIEGISLKRTAEFLKNDVVLRKLVEELVGELERAVPDELVSVVLYGSYAKGLASERSDVDVLVVVSTFDVRETVERVCDALGVRYGKEVAPLVTTASELGNMLKAEKPTVAHEVLLDGVVLWGYERYFSVVFEAVK